MASKPVGKYVVTSKRTKQVKEGKLENRSRTGKKLTLYQRAYHTMAQLPDAAARRKYLSKAIMDPKDEKFVENLELVAKNNPHFMIDKGSPEYQKVRSKSLIGKTMKQKDRESKKKISVKDKEERIDEIDQIMGSHMAMIKRGYGDTKLADSNMTVQMHHDLLEKERRELLRSY